ncbi:MAG: hypothetical protein Q4D81_04805, partial [Eubacteriales bacterium]|nr:hypothetical protein [Eubacteriales bacterium]
GGQSGTVAASDGGKTADAVTDEKKEDKAADREGRESAAAASEEKQKDNEITPAQTGSEEEPEESGNENAVTPVIVPSEEEKAEMESRSADSSEENAVTPAQTGSEEESKESGNQNAVTPAQSDSEEEPEESGNEEESTPVIVPSEEEKAEMESRSADSSEENAVTPAQTGSEEKAETGKSSEGKTGNDPADTGNETEKSPEGTSANSLEPAETEAAAQKPSGGEDAVTSARQKAYTEIVRAYAAALDQDRDSFLEDYANGLYDPEGINDQDGDGFGVMEGGLYVENAAEGDTEENGFSDGNAAEGDTEKDAEKDALRKAAAAGFDERINYELVREYFMYPEENRIFYGLTDYNADGIRELVFAIGNDQFRQVWTAYTFDGKKAVELFRGPYGLGERTILFTLPDKTFMIRASGGAFSGGETFCRIAEDLSGLETIAEYEYDERANGNLDRIATENHPASSGDGGEEQWPATITDEEFQERFVEKASSPADGISFEPVSADASVGD